MNAGDRSEPVEVHPSARAAWRLGWLVLAGLGAGTLAGFAGRWHWLLELASHFRLQLLYAALVLVAGFALFGWLSRRLFGRRGIAARSRRIAVVTAIVVAMANGITIAPLYFGPAQTVAAAEPRPRLRVLLANVHTSNREHAALIELVGRESPDVVVLQETDATWLTALRALHSDYPHRVVQPRGDNFGIALFSRRPLLAGEVRFLGAANVPSIVARIDHGGKPLHIVATHPIPPVRGELARLRNEQLARVAGVVRDLGPRTVLVGDFNSTAWSPVFRELLATSGLLDSARGFGPQPTWPLTLPLPCRIPIDHVLHTRDLEVLDRRTGSAIGSDHLPVVVDLR